MVLEAKRSSHDRKPRGDCYILCICIIYIYTYVYILRTSVLIMTPTCYKSEYNLGEINLTLIVINNNFFIFSKVTF